MSGQGRSSGSSGLERVSGHGSHPGLSGESATAGNGAPRVAGDPELVLNEFLRLYLEDQGAGRERALAEYQALFPGHESGLAREYELLRSASTPASGGAGPVLGQHFGPYVLVRPLGRGGQGRVWLARDTRLGRPVALKLLAELAALSPHALERFHREARIASRLSDPGICTVYETGTEQGLQFIAMRYVEGETLAQRLEAARAAGGPPLALPPEPGREGQDLTDLQRVARLVERLARSLEEAHEAGVVHRDVKPGNVILGRDGLPVVVDFGLASIQDQELATLTRTGDALGTPAYMSPEQLAEGGHRADRRSDVYALGVLLYECLTLHRPFEADSQAALQRAILGSDPPDPRRYLPGVPEDLRTILAVSLEKDRERRYATAAELAEDLRRFRAGEPLLAHGPGQVYRIRKLVRRHRVIVSSLVAILLVLTVAAAVTLREKAEATKRALEVLRLSDLQDLQELSDEADRLCPAVPELVPAFEDWERRAAALLEHLPDHERKLAELRARALPLTEEERARQAAAHPDHMKLQNLRDRLASVRRQEANRLAPDLQDPRAEDVGIDWSTLASDPKLLAMAAWPLIDPDRKSNFGSEERGLVLARRAAARIDAAAERDRPAIWDTLCWALFANGRFDEARALALAAEQAGQYGARLDRLTKEIDGRTSPAGVCKAAEIEAHLAAEAEVLEARISAATERSFESSLDRWWHDQLSRLVLGLRDFGDPERGLLTGRSPEHGWGVSRRLEWARTIVERSISGEDARRRWAEAIASIRDGCPAYRGLELQPQLGLLPIGRDPVSGLWEFAHLQSGEPAVRAADGKLVLSEDTGLVLVLLPGGTSWLGAQKEDPLRPNYDPNAAEREAPVCEVTLAPFFLSKYEMTQSQWLRATGVDPSKENPDSFSYSWNARGLPIDLLHPVEEVSWHDCRRTLERLELRMPTEAQWEYAARAGTSTPWWTGAEETSLQGAANLSDRFVKEHGGDTAWEAAWNSDLWLDDGSSVHQTVGSYRPNPFGLHDVIGNVMEWCRDGFLDYDFEPRDKDGERAAESPRMRSQRGGDFLSVATAARSSIRYGQDPEFHQVFLGVRPSMSLAATPAAPGTSR